MTRRGSVAAGYARALVELAVSKGASRTNLIQRSGIRPADLQDQDNRIPFTNYIALMRAGKELSGDPALALHFGEMFDISEMSIVGLIGLSCETLADAFVQLNRYARLVAEVEVGTADRLLLERTSEGLWIIDTRRDPNEFPELTESSFARMACMSRRFGTNKFLRMVHVTHPQPTYRAEYDRIFQVPVVFGSARNAVLTDEDWLTLGTGASSRYVFGILSAHADGLLKQLESTKSTRSRIESTLLPILHTGDANIEVTARKLGLSRQTLFRRLKEEGATFEMVLDELRCKMALEYLRNAKTSVNETAYLVGFSEPSAFSRAFRRWTGTSPRDFKAFSSRRIEMNKVV